MKNLEKRIGIETGNAKNPFASPRSEDQTKEIFPNFWNNLDKYIQHPIKMTAAGALFGASISLANGLYSLSEKINPSPDYFLDAVLDSMRFTVPSYAFALGAGSFLFKHIICKKN